jgi:HEAT repeat protein
MMHFQRTKEILMPVFLIERNFAEQLEVNPEIAAALNELNDAAGVEWLISFLSADKKKTYCLYEAPNAQAIREAARQAGLPADSVIEVGELMPDGLIGPVRNERFAMD